MAEDADKEKAFADFFIKVGEGFTVVDIADLRFVFEAGYVAGYKQAQDDYIPYM